MKYLVLLQYTDIDRDRTARQKWAGLCTQAATSRPEHVYPVPLYRAVQIAEFWQQYMHAQIVVDDRDDMFSHIERSGSTVAAIEHGIM